MALLRRWNGTVWEDLSNNLTNTPTAGGGAYGDGTTVAFTAAGTSGDVLTSGGAGAPTWKTRAHDIQIFTASGTWTKPTGRYSFVRVRMVGGGAGGAGGTGAASGQSQGAGGGGGGYLEHVYSIAALAATETVTVGTGGAGGVANAVSTAGNNSTFSASGTLLTANGGAASPGGFTSATSSGASTAGIGGAVSATPGNVVNVAGGDGGVGRTILGVTTATGFGGASFLSGQIKSLLGAGTGPTGKNYGGGGGGAFVATATFNGGPGAPGIVIVETW